MKLVFCAVGIAALLLPTPAVRGQGGYDAPNKTDVFNAGPQVYHVQPKKPNPSATAAPSHPRPGKAPVARLNRGEIVQVMSCPRSARPELAFYLPTEATSIVQLVVERRGSEMNYFIKGLSAGSTVGGAVQREWLDSTGFKPRNLADEARIQAALKRNPLYIEVH